MNKIDEQVQLAIKVMYERVNNYNEVSEHFGVAPSTVWSFVNYWGDYKKLRELRREQRATLAQKSGCKSYAEYTRKKAEKRQKRNKILSRLIKDTLREKGVEQNWLADFIGVTKQAVSNIILGKNRLGREKLPRLANALGLDLETLLNAGGYQ